jgi:rubrerythrin
MDNISEAIRTAIKMEESGIDFYQKAREKTSYPLARKMFLSFTEDEKRHLTVLKKILTDLKFSDFEQFFGEKPRQKIENIFKEARNEIKERIVANPDELETLKIGMDMELESVKFYQTALEKSEDNHQKAFLRRLVEEEKEHLQLLQNTYSYLKNSGDWFLWEEKGLLDGG